MSNQSLREAAQQALEFMESQECRHENTHRGGAIWEICDDCDAKWADDRGGKPKYREPKAISTLRAALAQPDDKAQPPAEQNYFRIQEAADKFGLDYNKLCSAIRHLGIATSQQAAEQPEPEWIDDPHDIEQGMMRNPKWKPAERGAELSDYPPLPEPAYISHQTDSVMRSYEIRSYSDRQMHEYVDADRAARGGGQ